MNNYINYQLNEDVIKFITSVDQSLIEIKDEDIVKSDKKQ